MAAITPYYYGPEDYSGYWRSPEQIAAEQAAVKSGKASTGPTLGSVSIPTATNVAQTSAAGNLAALPDITSITNAVNDLLRAAQQKANIERVPGGQGLEEASSKNIAQALGGQLPQDVITQMSQLAAQRGVATGSPTGPSTNAALLRAIGQNSLGLMGTGQDWLTAATARNPAAPLFNPQNLMLTPAQSGQLGLEADRLGLQRQLAILEDQRERQRMALAAQAAAQRTPAYTGQPNAMVTPPKPTPDTSGLFPTDPLTGYDFTTGSTGGTTFAWYGDKAGYDPFGFADFMTPTVPTGTVYNPTTDTSTYDPYAGMGGWDMGVPSVDDLLEELYNYRF